MLVWRSTNARNGPKRLAEEEDDAAELEEELQLYTAGDSFLSFLLDVRARMSLRASFGE